jgi:serine acetyltransferase
VDIVKGSTTDVTLHNATEATSTYPPGDVRNDPIGPVNKFINWIFMGKKPRLLRRLVGMFFHIELPALAYPVRMAHPFGIVVNGGARLGRNVTIYQHVTIGSKRVGRNAGVARIGDDVVIFPNPVIVGAVSIGEGAVIAPGAVVIDDVPTGATAAGNPARIIDRRADKS